MTVREKVEGFLNAVSNVYLGYNAIHFFEPENVTAEQVGYSVTSDGKPLTSGRRGDWKEDWLAIAYEEFSGEPLFVNMRTPALKVLSAQHGEQGWDPFVIADSLDNLQKIVELIQPLTEGRQDEEELENKPITDAERQPVLAEIKKQNPQAEMWYWENFLENV